MLFIFLNLFLVGDGLVADTQVVNSSGKAMKDLRISIFDNNPAFTFFYPSSLRLWQGRQGNSLCSSKIHKQHLRY